MGVSDNFFTWVVILLSSEQIPDTLTPSGRRQWVLAAGPDAVAHLAGYIGRAISWKL